MNQVQPQRSIHLIYTPFTGVGLHGGFRGQKWFEHRINIFKNYTLKSLRNQTNQSFIHWFSFRPEERNNRATIDLANYLMELKYPFIFTFDGLMYWDDKFTDHSWRTILRNLMMMAWDCWKYKELKNPFKMLSTSVNNKNQTLKQRVGRSLETLKETLGDRYDWVYLTRIDSDDMFHKNVIEEVQKYTPDYKKAVVFLKGYAHNLQTGQLVDWKSPVDANPPYHTIVFPGDTFFDAAKHVEYYGPFKSHEDIPKCFKCEYGEPGRYCFTTHGKNISTSWTSYLLKVQNAFIYNEYFGEEKDSILKDFGL